MTAHIARAVYLHVPFCRHRCGYCNFTLIAGRDELIPRYLTCLQREMESLRQTTEVDTIFIGGGTPTHLPPHHLRQLLEFTQERFPLAIGGEFSVEANPIDITPEKVDLLADAGVTRLSLGAQSFSADKLAMLERDHDAEIIRQAVQTASGRMEQVSLDLIFAAPGEALSGWRDDLQAAIDLKPDHISTYGLTIERGTRFYARSLKDLLETVPEEAEELMYQTAIDTLATAGFEHYETSNFAQPGARCRHNEGYWRQRPYFAFGPGASRFLGGERSTNHRSTLQWMKRIEAGVSPIADRECLAPEPAARERLVFGLRMMNGIDLNDFEAATQFSVDDLAGDEIAQLIEHGLLERQAGRLRLTRRGLMVSDGIWPHLLTE